MIRDAGFPVEYVMGYIDGYGLKRLTQQRDVSAITGAPEILGGRVKTLV